MSTPLLNLSLAEELATEAVGTVVLGVDPGLEGGLVWIDTIRRVRCKLVMPVVEIHGRNRYDNPAIVAAVRELIPTYIVVESARPMPSVKREESRSQSHSECLGGVCGACRAKLQQPDLIAIKGSAGQFHSGYGLALWHMLGAALGIPIREVWSQTWQRTMLRGAPGGTKERAQLVIRQVWPGESFLATPRSRKFHEGLVDAALIALYGIENF